MQLAGVEHIIHAGDIGKNEVIAGLQDIAPTTAVRGNVDTGKWAARYPINDTVTLAGRTIYVLHNVRELDVDPTACGVQIVVSGHSHRPKIETVDGVLFLNPGSAGPRRFSLPVTVATLVLSGRKIDARIHEIVGRNG